MTAEDRLGATSGTTERVPEEALSPVPSNPRVFAVTTLKLPALPLEHGVDLDGNGTPDNRLGFTIASLMAQGFDLQASVDDAIAAGAPVLLLAVDVERDDRAARERAEVVVSVGRPADPTMTSFVTAPGFQAVTIIGRLSAGVFHSDPPSIGGEVASLLLPLPLFPGHPLRLTARPVVVTFKVVDDWSELSMGRVCGATEPADLAGQFGAGLAGMMTSFIAAHPESRVSQQITRLFDTGGCTNPDGTVAAAADHIISPCEITSSALYRALVAPDVHLFDQLGGYSPTTTPPMDRLSFGFGFTARRATVLPPPLESTAQYREAE